MLVKVSFEKSLSFPLNFWFSLASCTFQVDTKLLKDDATMLMTPRKDCWFISLSICWFINLSIFWFINLSIDCLLKFLFHSAFTYCWTGKTINWSKSYQSVGGLQKNMHIENFSVHIPFNMEQVKRGNFLTF